MIAVAIAAVVLAVAVAGGFVLTRRGRGATADHPVPPRRARPAPAGQHEQRPADVADEAVRAAEAAKRPGTGDVAAKSAPAADADDTAEPLTKSGATAPAKAAEPADAGTTAPADDAAEAEAVLARRASPGSPEPAPAPIPDATLAPPAGTEKEFEAASSSAYVQPAELAFDQELLDRLAGALRPAGSPAPRS